MTLLLFRQLPAVDRLLSDPRLAPLPRGLTLRVARRILDELRALIAAGAIDELPDIPQRVAEQVEGLRKMRLRRVINATGIVLHTNLGRAPLSAAAARAVSEVAAGYSNVEMELVSGLRGGRLDGVREPLRLLLGAEDAIAVNNNAAAVVLVLAALARGREVIVSRGELVEIGGSFRVPDILATSGAILREVGTTNRTRAADYARAIGPQTALLMRVHPSNFRQIGFVERPETAELAQLGPPLVEDLGSGALVPGLGEEPRVAEVLAAGAALVCFSGDKLLGGPQAGIIAGRADLVADCRKHPLYRALRMDKLGLAALEATLRLYLEEAPVPVPAMLGARPSGEAEALRDALVSAGLERAGVQLSVEDDVGYSGGGALPGEALPSRVLVLRAPELEAMAARLRMLEVPVIARLSQDSLRFDPRTLLPGDADTLVAAILSVCSISASATNRL